MYGLVGDNDQTCSYTGFKVTKTAKADIIENEACYLENIDYCFEEMQEDDFCDSPLVVMESGCKTCKVCGWSACHIA